MTKVLCVIDSLGSGGAQRQMVNLACGLKARGYNVAILVYFPDHDFFRPTVDQEDIKVYEFNKRNGFSFGLIKYLVTLLRHNNYDAVISFLDSPNMYVEMAKLLVLKRIIVIVGERSAYLGRLRVSRVIKNFFHIFADYVVANSFTHARWLERFPWMRGKTRVIYNGYSTLKVKGKAFSQNKSQARLLVIGRIDPGKNGVRLLQALVRFQERNGYVPYVSWAGRQEQDPKSLLVRSEMDEILSGSAEIGARWKWLGEQDNVSELLAECDGLVHVSLFEGLPNAICEAFLSGRPVVASAVCDHPALVDDGVRGFLCDPYSVSSICESIERFVGMPPAQWEGMGRNARDYAVRHLSRERMVSEYEALFFKPQD